MTVESNKRWWRRWGAVSSVTTATKTLLWWYWVVNAACFGTGFGTATQSPNTSPWLLRASSLQRFLTYDMPLNQVPMVATHNSYNTEEAGVSTQWETVPNQVYSLTQQLSCLGVRGLELDIHYVEELMRDGRSQEEATLVCHTRPSSAQEIHEVCSRLRWYLCEALGIQDFGDDTGCSSTAPSLKETFDEISAWLDLPENSEELLFIKIEDYTGDNVSLLPDYITTVFGTEIVFGPLDFIEWNRISGIEQWPTTEYLVSQGKRLVFGTNGQEHADTMFRIGRENDADGLFHEDNISAIRFRTSAPCSTRTRSPSWSRVQGEASTWVIEYTDVTLYALLPEADEFFGASDAMDALECGLIPTFDRMDSRLLGATMWSWEEGEPHAYFSSPRAAVVHQETGRWTSGSASTSEEESEEIHSYACRNDSKFRERGEWLVSSGAAGNFSAAELVCLSQGLVFGCPRTAIENAALRVSMTDVGVKDAWVNLRSPGGALSSSWARESGVAYTLPTTYTHATCDGGGYSGAADFTWNADEAWTYGDRAFYDKAERIKDEAQALRAEAELLESSSEGQEGTLTGGIDEVNALKAAAMWKKAEQLENAAREAGAYPKGW